MKPIISLLWGLVVLVICHLTAWADISAPPQNIQLQIGSIPTTKSITQYGITWTFAEPVPYGQFANGDFWVIDPGTGVKIINITPGDAIREGTTQHMNGSMLNPNDLHQGYDGYHAGYSAPNNVGIGVSLSTPLILTGNVSLVSTISNLIPDGSAHLSYVKNAAVLTCLSSAPPSGSFRPGISSASKTLHNESSIDYSKLGHLVYPTTKPDLQPYTEKLQMVWLIHNPDASGRLMRPSGSGLDNYYFPTTFSKAALLLHFDYTNEQKRSLLINFIQLGIDIYSYIESGAKGWEPDGGQSGGRKWPILFAGIMLDYVPMKNIGLKSGDYLYANGHSAGNPPSDYIHFGEDGQTFYVAQSDVDITNGPTWAPDTRNSSVAPYTSSLIGMPEWGIRYSKYPNKSDASWGASYRTIGSNMPAWQEIVMACRIMGAKHLWNHNAFFDYVDRYMAISKGNQDPFGYIAPNEKAGGRPDALIWDHI